MGMPWELKNDVTPNCVDSSLAAHEAAEDAVRYFESGRLAECMARLEDLERFGTQCTYYAKYARLKVQAIEAKDDANS